MTKYSHAERRHFEVVGFEQDFERVQLPFGSALPLLRTADRAPAGTGQHRGEEEHTGDERVDAPVQPLATGHANEKGHDCRTP